MLKKEIEFHEEARSETLAAHAWYSERSEVVASRFVSELEQSLGFIQAGPKRWPGYVSDTRRFFLRHFPFVVVYRETADTIQVLALAHMRRRPGYWKLRESNRS